MAAQKRGKRKLYGTLAKNCFIMLIVSKTLWKPSSHVTKLGFTDMRLKWRYNHHNGWSIFAMTKESMHEVDVDCFLWLSCNCLSRTHATRLDSLKEFYLEVYGRMCDGIGVNCGKQELVVAFLESLNKGTAVLSHPSNFPDMGSKPTFSYFPN